MERVGWTDERLDDLSRRMDAGFARVDEDLRELRREMHDGFADLSRRLDGPGSQLREEIGGVRNDTASGFMGVRGEIEVLRHTMLRVGGGVMVGLVGVIAAILTRGV